MDRIEQLLYKVVRAQIWGGQIQQPEISSSDYHALMNMAMKQTVAGLVMQCVSDGRLKVELSPADAMKTLLLQRQIEQQNELLNAEVAALCEMFQRNNVRFIVFKGQTLARLYPHPNARTSGDIDFYVPAEDYERATEIISKEWNIEIEHSTSHQHTEFEHNKVIFEMHFEMLKFFNKKVQRDFDSMIQNSEIQYIDINGCKVPTLDPIANLVYTFAHLWYHLLELGIGMRQLCDLALLINDTFPANGEDNSEKIQQLRAQLKSLGILKAFGAVENMLHSNLGLPYAPLNIKTRKYHQREILRRVMRYGNFGKYGRKGSRADFSFYISLTFERVATFFKFYTLDKKEIRARLFWEIPEKILAFIK